MLFPAAFWASGQARALDWQWYLGVGAMNGGDHPYAVAVETCTRYYGFTSCSVQRETLAAGTAGSCPWAVSWTSRPSRWTCAWPAPCVVSADNGSIAFERPHTDLALELRAGKKHRFCLGLSLYEAATLDLSDLGAGKVRSTRTRGRFLEWRYVAMGFPGIAFRKAFVDFAVDRSDGRPVAGRGTYGGDYKAVFLGAVFWPPPGLHRRRAARVKSRAPRPVWKR